MKMSSLLFLVGAGVIGWRLWVYLSQTTQKNIELKARTAWGEARGQGDAGLQAVINVIDNRVKAKSWFGATVEEVIFKPFQFSLWNRDAFDQLDKNGNLAQSVNENDQQYKKALELAKLSEQGKLNDITGGADHYHADYVAPTWANKMTQTAIIGNHIFYRS